MYFPKLCINKEIIKENTISMLNECKKRGLEFIAVEKLVAGDLEISQLLVDCGIKTLADSRVLNLKKIKDIKAKKMLLRLPMKSEITEVIMYSDICLISEIETIILLNEEAKKYNKIYEIILMIELGDIREGLFDTEIIKNTMKEIQTMTNIKLEGLGTNFACFGATVPSVEKLQELVNLKYELEKEFNITLNTLSGGNSSHISIWDENIPEEINQIRSGAAFLMGFGLNDEPIPFLKMNAFTLRAEIIEVQTKPSVSWGKKGLDAFGHEKIFEDLGNRQKAIIAIGRQDCPYEDMTPIDINIKVLGQSSDHTILDITDSKQELAVGDIIDFNLGYIGVLSSITSEFVSTSYK